MTNNKLDFGSVVNDCATATENGGFLDKIRHFNGKDAQGNLAIHRAVLSKDMNELLNLVKNPLVNVDAVNGEGRTALHLAVQDGNAEAVFALSAAHANVNLKDKYYNTVRDNLEKILSVNAHKYDQNYVRISQIIKAPVNNLMKSGTIFLDEECKIVHNFGIEANSQQGLATVVALDKNGYVLTELKNREASGEKPLLLSGIKTDAQGGLVRGEKINNGIIEKLMLKLRGLEHKSAAEQKTLDFLSSCKKVSLEEVPLDQIEVVNVGDVVKVMDNPGVKGGGALDKIAQLNAKYQHGNTALHLAIKRNNMEDFGKLVNNPLVDIDAVNENGQTPLHFVAFKGNHQAAATLIHFGANPNVKDVNGQSAKDYAEKNAGRSADHAKTLELIKQDYVAKGLVKSGTIFVDSECNIVESFGLTPNSKQATATVVALDKDGNAVSELRFTTGKAGEFGRVLKKIETDSEGKVVANGLSNESVKKTLSALRADDYLNKEEKATLDFLSGCDTSEVSGDVLDMLVDIF